MMRAVRLAIFFMALSPFVIGAGVFRPLLALWVLPFFVALLTCEILTPSFYFGKVAAKRTGTPDDPGADGTHQENSWGYGAAATAALSVGGSGFGLGYATIVNWLFPMLALLGVHLAWRRFSRLSMCLFFGATLGFTATWAGVAFNRVGDQYNVPGAEAVVGFPLRQVEVEFHHLSGGEAGFARLNGRSWSYLLFNFCLLVAAFTALAYVIPRRFLLELNLASPYLACLGGPLVWSLMNFD